MLSSAELSRLAIEHYINILLSIISAELNRDINARGFHVATQNTARHRRTCWNF